MTARIAEGKTEGGFKVVLDWDKHEGFVVEVREKTSETTSRRIAKPRSYATLESALRRFSKDILETDSIYK